MTVHLDISQLVLEPRRTGIQRVERELIRHWPGNRPLVACCYDPHSNGLRELPHAILDVLCDDAPDGGVPAERARLARYVQLGAPVPAERVRLLNVELFVDPARAGFYRALAEHGAPRLSWLVNDFLPWLDPGWFNPGAAGRLMPYLHALRAVPRLAFISGKTRHDYMRRIARKPDVDPGPVLLLGGDGLGLKRQAFTANRRDFVMLGSIEPRKHTAAVMRAFQRLWRDGADAGLTLIGPVAPDQTEELALLRALAGQPRFRHLQNLPDAGVRDVMRGARAMLFPSEGEGFGLPAMEALHAGLPVVVSAALPCIEGLPPLGQVRLAEVNPSNVAGVIVDLLDDSRAARLWKDAAELVVPGWREFSHAVAGWVEA